MKRKRIVRMVTLLPIVQALTASAADINKYEDAEQLAQAYLLHVSDHYSGSLCGQVLSTSNQFVPIKIDFVMTKSLFVTNMAINGTNIPLPKPLGGLPIPDSGYQSANIELCGWDRAGDWASRGSFSTNFLHRESSV